MHSFGVLGPTLSFEWWGLGAARIATGERKDRKRTFGKFFKWRLRLLGFLLGRIVRGLWRVY